MSDLAKTLLQSVSPEDHESVFLACTLRIDTSGILGTPSTYDCENGELHDYSGKSLEITPERDAALRAWAAARNTWTEAELRAAISERRWKSEVCGCEVLPGVRFPTSRDARAAFALELDRARAKGPSYSKTYEISGHLIPVTLATLEHVSESIQSHVDAAFARSAALIQRIDNGEDLAIIAQDIDTGWPVSP